MTKLHGNLKQLSDEELMLAYQKGDSKSFEIIYERHSARVYGFIRSKLSDRAAADDALQATFLKLHQSRSKYDASLPFAPWLFTVCRSAIVDVLRAKQRVGENEELNPILIESAVAAGEAPATPLPDLDQLPENQKRALELRYLEELSFDEMALLEAQRETLHEVARSAESRHAVGAVPQQDEMKAHVEETKIETDLISAQEEQAMAEASLNAVMNREANAEIPLPKEDLPVPKLNASIPEIENMAYQNSRQIRAAQYSSDSADTARILAAWGFAPDFMLTYRKAFVNAPPNAYSFEVALSIPLWFFAKQTGDYRAAIAESVAAEKNLELTRVNTSAEVKSLISKVVSHEKLLEIYQTSLIPQASTSLSSSRGAYQAGRTGFLELLDSERSLYAVRIAYYRTLSEYVDYLTQLEKVVGTRLSTLPMGGSL